MSGERLQARLSIVVIGILAFVATPAHAQPQDATGDDAAEGEAVEAEAPTEGEAEAEEAPAEPEDPNVVEARERIARANELFNNENYDAAVAEFTEILELLGEHPVRFQVLYNIAKSYEALFRYGKAMEYYQQFLAEGGGETALAPEVNAKIQLLEGLLGTILIVVDVPEYEVWVDDRMVGNDLERVLVPGGSHVVEIRSPGYVQNQKEVQVPARTERTIEFELEELAEEFEGLPPWMFWTAGGLAVLAAAGGVVYGVLALVRRNEIDDIMRNDPLKGVGIIGVEDQEEVRNLARNADIFYGAALLFGTAAVIFAVFTEWGDEDEAEGSDGESEATLRLSPAVGPTSTGLWLEGSF
jgi:tetratricopeptide (TPR) repeat protein